MGALSTVFIDVGGVLWHFHDEPAARALRIERLAAACYLSTAGASSLLTELERRIVEPQDLDRFDVLAELRDAVADIGLTGDVATIRRAMCVPAGEWVTQSPGMQNFLIALGEEGLRRVIVSNVIWRAAEDYWRDFSAQGVADQIDGVVSSLDALVRKPHPLIFEIALATAGDPLPSTCVMIGDTEDKDVSPARALGMYTILVAQHATTSAADAVVASLDEAAAIISAWNRDPPVRGVVTTAVGPLTVTLANDSADERHVRDLLAQLLDRYDASPFIFTNQIRIEDDAVPVSHPVLTLGTKFSVRTPVGVMATFLHEQLHWHVKDGSSAGAIEELRSMYPTVPVGRRSGGARNTWSTYLHLIVNHLELQALVAVVGEESAFETARAQVIYRWVYQTVLRDFDRIDAVIHRHGLALP